MEKGTRLEPTVTAIRPPVDSADAREQSRRCSGGRQSGKPEPIKLSKGDPTKEAHMTFNSQILNQVITLAKTKAAGNPRWLRAIDRAVEGLTGGWYVTELVGSTLVTTEGGSYFVNGHCGCRAGALGLPCKHRCAVRLLALYNEAVARAASDDRAELIAAIKATWSRNCPGENLADALMHRFGCNSLSFLATGWLRDILAAIA